MEILFNYLIFPGFLFSAIIGLLAGWVDRKVTARIHYRVGPPWYQNFMDLAKLFTKEIIVPARSKFTFLAAPFLGLASSILVAALIGNTLINPEKSFVGDIIVVLYLLAMPAISLIIGASASANPLASVGVSREIKLLLGYELPFILSIIIVIIKTGSINLGEIVNYQMSEGSIVASFSGIIAFIVSILCVQAKLGLVPFDAAEAEQEIMAGTLIEYSGLPLAIFKLTKAILLYSLPMFLITIFWSNELGLSLVYKYVVILVIIILIKNTNPRLKIDQAVRFFWGPLTLLAVFAIILVFLGRVSGCPILK